MTPTPTVSPRMGAALKAARTGARISRRALAQQAGVDHTHVARFENGERPISEAMYAHLQAALAVLIEQQEAA